MKPILFLIPAVQAGTVIWNGLFNESSTVDQLDECTDSSLPPPAYSETNYKRVLVQPSRRLPMVHPRQRENKPLSRGLPGLQEPSIQGWKGHSHDNCTSILTSFLFSVKNKQH